MERIVIVDSCPIVCRGLRSLLAQVPQVRVHAEAQNEAQLLKLLNRQSFDLAILDIHFAGAARGLPILQRIVELWPRTAVLIYTANDDEYLVTRALKMGAAGYILKQCAEEEIVRAIRTVSSGAKYVAQSLAQKLALLQCSTTDKGKFSLEVLSVRELRVFEGLALGKPIVKIAEDLCLSPKTVTSYRARVLEKLVISSNSELTRLAVEHTPYLFSKAPPEMPSAPRRPTA